MLLKCICFVWLLGVVKNKELSCFTCSDVVTNGTLVEGPKVWRDDLRCGVSYNLSDGSAAQCNPDDTQGRYRKLVGSSAPNSIFQFDIGSRRLRGTHFSTFKIKVYQNKWTTLTHRTCCSQDGYCGASTLHCCPGCADYTRSNSELLIHITARPTEALRPTPSPVRVLLL